MGINFLAREWGFLRTICRIQMFAQGSACFKDQPTNEYEMDIKEDVLKLTLLVE